MKSDVDKFANLIIDLIELNESILNTINYDDLMDKRNEALILYDKYEAVVENADLSDTEMDSLNLLNSYLHRTNKDVIDFLEKRIVNIRIKQRILEDRKKDLNI